MEVDNRRAGVDTRLKDRRGKKESLESRSGGSITSQQQLRLLRKRTW